jgi:hypothetical protein
MLLRIERQRVRFTGDGIDLTTRLTNRIDDSFFLIAT